MAGVWLARLIIGVRCEPSPAHDVHCMTPAVLVAVAGTSIVTLSGAAAAAVVLGGQEERRRRATSRGPRPVDGSIRQAVWKWPRCRPCAVEERALQVVAARGRAEEPVAHQVAGADHELEGLVDPDVPGELVISSEGSWSSGGDLTHGGAHALRVRRLEARVRRQLAGRAVPAEDVQAVVGAGPAPAGMAPAARGAGAADAVRRGARPSGGRGRPSGPRCPSPRRPGPGSSAAPSAGRRRARAGRRRRGAARSRPAAAAVSAVGRRRRRPRTGSSSRSGRRARRRAPAASMFMPSVWPAWVGRSSCAAPP